MQIKAGSFRFTYFTEKYQETCEFYKEKLAFKPEHSWDRGADDKGALFRIGEGLIEVLQRPKEASNQYPALDYRVAQGVFAGIQVWDIDELFAGYKARGVDFNHELIEQSWGHKSFYVAEPNGLILGFYQEQF